MKVGDKVKIDHGGSYIEDGKILSIDESTQTCRLMYTVDAEIVEFPLSKFIAQSNCKKFYNILCFKKKDTSHVIFY